MAPDSVDCAQAATQPTMATRRRPGAWPPPRLCRRFGRRTLWMTHASMRSLVPSRQRHPAVPPSRFLSVLASAPSIWLTPRRRSPASASPGAARARSARRTARRRTARRSARRARANRRRTGQPAPAVPAAAGSAATDRAMRPTAAPAARPVQRRRSVRPEPASPRAPVPRPRRACARRASPRAVPWRRGVSAPEVQKTTLCALWRLGSRAPVLKPAPPARPARRDSPVWMSAAPACADARRAPSCAWRTAPLPFRRAN